MVPSGIAHHKAHRINGCRLFCCVGSTLIVPWRFRSWNSVPYALLREQQMVTAMYAAAMRYSLGPGRAGIAAVERLLVSRSFRQNGVAWNTIAFSYRGVLAQLPRISALLGLCYCRSILQRLNVARHVERCFSAPFDTCCAQLVPLTLVSRNACMPWQIVGLPSAESVANFGHRL